jgi:putative DNA primase/helicase
MFDSLGDYALKYARHGWAVHALKPRQKIPATPHGCKDASTDEDIVRAMWGDQPYNIGLATGLASGIFVFDVDSAPPKDGGLTGPDALSELVAQHGPLPATMTVRTGSGAHYYFRMPVGVDLNNRARITVRGQRTGLDVRADGGYVVAPPSIHPNGGIYMWEPGTREIADAPAWLIDLVKKEAPKPAATKAAAPVAVAPVTDDDTATASEVLEHACESIRTCQGSRHDEIYRQAARVGQLVGGGCIARDVAEFELVSAGLATGKPDTEVRRTVRDGLDRGAQSPRRPSDSPMTIPPTSYRPTDVGNAARLVDRFGGDVRWCGSAQGDGFLVWDGVRWAPDTMRRVDHMTREVARDVVDYALDMETRMRAAAQATGGKPTPSQQAALNALREEVKTWRKWAKDSEMVAHLRASLTTARVDVAIAQEALDADQWSLNTRTGVVDLRTGTARPHAREDLHTKVTGAGVGESACPVWLAFLTRIMGGDADMVAFIQRVVGYCLTGSTREQCLFILYGNGSNGKSTFLDTVRAVFGDYAQHSRAETFMKDRKSGGIPNDVAALRGARLVTSSEPEQGAQLDESLIKEMTGDAAISARFMRQEFFTFMPTFKVLLATNHRPVIRGTDHGIWRRIRLVPFTETIRDEEKDRDLGKKLEAEADAILAWGIEGARLWSEHGLQEPAAVREATEDYRADMDVLADFVSEKCALHGVSTNTELYKAFMEWQQANGEKPRSQKWLTRALIDRGYKQDPSRKYGRRWIGLSLRETPEAHIREVTRW